ncbi:MAG: hypothetical protein mread185_000645 [Mycoplasmataceae bacterium]|nr:MAG: hypothetical protein mread185_000645 [Mycoplasmataceae bacterium]
MKISDPKENKLTDEQLAKWRIFEETGILDGWDGDSVNINGEKTNPNESGFFATIIDAKNWNSFNGKTLVFRNCKNLKKIEANCLGLTGLRIEGQSRLEYLSAYNNELGELDLASLDNLKSLIVNDNKLRSLQINGCESLDFLSCRNNQLVELDLEDNHKLTYLNCSQNRIEELEVNRLNNLETFHCYLNCLLRLKCSKLTNLKDLNCHGNCRIITIGWEEWLSEVEIDGCENLERFDAAENGLISFRLINHPNLKVVSLKENQINKAEIDNLPNLEFLDISRQKSTSTSEIIPTKLIVGENIGNLKKLFYTKGTTIWKANPELREVVRKYILKLFPKLKKFECSNGETADFEEFLDALREEEEKKKLKRARQKKKKGKLNPENNEEEENQSEPIITDPSQLKDKNEYPDLLAEYGDKSEITITGQELTGAMIIDGYQGYKINVGNNVLSYLVVRNCPNLTTLRYAHNKMKHDAWYDKDKFNNPNLTIIDNYNWDGKLIWDEKTEEAFKESKLKGKERLNEKLKKPKLPSSPPIINEPINAPKPNPTELIIGIGTLFLLSLVILILLLKKINNKSN